MISNQSLLFLTANLYSALENLPDSSKASAEKNQTVQNLSAEIILRQNLILPENIHELAQTHQNIAMIIDRFKTIDNKGGFIAGRWFRHKSLTRKLAFRAIKKTIYIQKNLFYKCYLGNQYQILSNHHFTSENISNFIQHHQQLPKVKTPIKWNKTDLSLPRSMILTPNGKIYLLLTTKNDPTIGEGAYKVVKHCIEVNTGKKKIVAIIKKSKVLSILKCTITNLRELYWSNIIQLARREASSMGFWEGDHHIVQLDLYYEYRNKCYFIMENCGLGDLNTFLCKNISFSKNLLLCDLALGLHKIHQKGYLHRDIKPENIFLSQSQNQIIAKYGDLGLMCKELEVKKDKCGTLMFMAPELLNSSTEIIPYSKKADIWSLGCVFYEIFLRNKIPCLNKYTADVLYSIIESAPLKNNEKILLHGMLHQDPKKRWDSERVCFFVYNVL